MCHKLLQTEKYTKAIRKVTSGEPLTKQAMKKNIIYKKKHVHTEATSQHCHCQKCGTWHIGE